MDAVKSITMLVLGDRDYPLAPQVRLQGPLLQELTDLTKDGQDRLPDLTYEDVIRAVLRAGILQIERVLEAEGRIERGGHVSFSPVPSGQAGRRLDALRAAAIRNGRLNDRGLLIGIREEVRAPQPQGAKDTVSHAVES